MFECEEEFRTGAVINSRCCTGLRQRFDLSVAHGNDAIGELDRFLFIVGDEHQIL